MANPIQTPLSVAEIESWSRIDIPESAFDIQAYVQFNAAIYVKFQLPQNKFDEFLADAGFKHLENGYWPFSDTVVPWWPKSSEFDDKSGKVFAGETLALFDENFAKVIGVDMTDMSVYTIYLQCFDT